MYIPRLTEAQPDAVAIDGTGETHLCRIQLVGSVGVT